MALTRLVFIAALIAVSHAQMLEVDSFSIDSPSTIYGGANFDVQFDITFTPSGGAASIIESSASVLRFMPVLTLSGDGSTLSLDGYGTVNLTESQQTTDLTDDDSVTWNNLQTTFNLTDAECGNGTVFQYVCVSLMPYTGVTWSGVDTSNSSMCINFVCKAQADVTVTDLTVTNPDNVVISVGGGQAVEFDMTVSNPSSSDAVAGSTNWLIKAYLSDAETGGTTVAEETVTLTNAQQDSDLAAGSTLTFSDLAITLTLDDVTCDDFSHACVSVEPASNAYWTRPSSPSDNYLCVAAVCGACAIKTSIAVMLVAVIVSMFFNH